MSRVASKSVASAVTVPVDLGDRSYPIVIAPNLIEEAGERIAKLRPGAAVVVVTDEKLATTHLPVLKSVLAAADIRTSIIVVPAGEGSKSYATLERVVEAILAAKIERGDLVIAFGGGVIGDLAGFAAAITRRGIDLVQIPTTLLAQVDSSVGGKTGINSPHGKNLIGAFHQPLLVLIDTELFSLTDRRLVAGYSEVVKYGLIGDAPFFEWLEKNWREVFAGGEARVHAIATSCRHKASIVSRDERETGDRALLNFGHTFGHALETATDFSERLLHGEAISIGMVLAFRLSAHLGFADPGDEQRVAAHFAAAGLPTQLTKVTGPLPDADGLLELMAQDKKVRRGALTLVLTRGIGRAFVQTGVDPEPVRRVLNEALLQSP
jgi:3-dehydroquinate synthase